MWLKCVQRDKPLKGQRGDVAVRHLASYGPAGVEMIQLLDINFTVRGQLL